MWNKIGRHALEGLVVLVLTAFLAEGLTRILSLEPQTWTKPVMLETPDKSIGLECYPSEEAQAFPIDLGRPSADDPLGPWGYTDSARASFVAKTPHCVPFRYNTHTRRDADFTPTEGLSILVVGDSFTEGAGVPEADTLPRQLERELRARGVEARVWNGGRRGRNQPQLIEDVTRFAPLVQPDLVLYAAMLNDIETSKDYADQQNYLNDLVLNRQQMGHPTWKVPSWLQWSALARAIAGRIRRSDTTQETTRWYQGLIGPQNAEGWRRTQGDIGAMKREAERHGAQFCMAVLPILYGLERGYAFAEVHSALTDTAAQHNTPAIDLLPVLEGQPSASLWVHPVDMHPNARAHGLMAEPLAEFVVAQLRKP